MSLSYGYVGKIWQTGEIGLSREKKSNVLRTVQRTSPEERRWNAAMLSIHGLEVATAAYQKSIAPSSLIVWEDGASCPVDPGWRRTLGLSLVANSHRAERGSRGISKYGAKLVRNSAYVMEHEVESNRLSFLTLTLPNVSLTESKVISENWAEVVRVFVQRLRRTLRKAQLPGEVVGCTEVQEGRVALTGVFGLHLHFVFVGRKRRSSWAVSSAEIREFWQSALSPYLSNPVKAYDWRASERIEMVKKSASGYLGKYMSKGLKAVSALRQIYPDVKFPSSWYICTNSLRKRTKKGVLRVSGDIGRVLADLMESRIGVYVAYSQAVRVKVQGADIPIGYVGRLTEEGKEVAKAIISHHREGLPVETLVFCEVDVK